MMTTKLFSDITYNQGKQYENLHIQSLLLKMGIEVPTVIKLSLKQLEKERLKLEEMQNECSTE